MADFLFVKLQFLMLKAHRSGWTYTFGFLLFAYMNVLILARGSGLDLYLSYVLVAGVLVAICMSIASVLKLSIGRRRRVKP